MPSLVYLAFKFSITEESSPVLIDSDSATRSTNLNPWLNSAPSLVFDSGNSSSGVSIFSDLLCFFSFLVSAFCLPFPSFSESLASSPSGSLFELSISLPPPVTTAGNIILICRTAVSVEFPSLIVYQKLS